MEVPAPTGNPPEEGENAPSSLGGQSLAKDQFCKSSAGGAGDRQKVRLPRLLLPEKIRNKLLLVFLSMMVETLDLG